MPLSPAFDQALRDAIALLRAAPRRRADVPSARRQFAAYQQSHPDVPARLAVELPPGEERADYDVLLDAGDGTLAVSWSADEAMPWFVDHADHWAASHVVTVNGSSLSVQDALQVVRIAGASYPDLHDLLIRDALRREAMGSETHEVTAAELQEAADEFRLSNGLLSAEATHRWLAERGLSVGSFQRLLRGGVEARKARAKLTADRVEPFFAENAALFDTVTVATVECRSPALLEELRGAAAEQGGLAEAALACARRASAAPLRLTVEDRRAHTLAAELRQARPGALVSPAGSESGSAGRLHEVIARRPAALDASTRAAVEEYLFREWLDARRKGATIAWHWE
jgi:putative peptide maturation system protein